MTHMSLAEICRYYCFSRRVLQGYEKEGLITHCGRNKYGHLLYDYPTVEKIALIRYLQLNGFTLQRIAAIKELSVAALPSLLKAADEAQRTKMKQLEEKLLRNQKLEELLRSEDVDQRTVIQLIREEIINEKTI